MRKVGEGDKSEVYVLRDGRILKLFRPEYAYLFGAEARICRILDRAGVDLPRVDGRLDVDGRPGIIFRDLPEGETLSEAVRRRPWTIVSAARRLAELHAEVHACSAPELPSQRVRMETQILSSSALGERARDVALRALEDLPDGRAACHNDIHMLNVIVHPGGTVLIDWVLAGRGNPLADVATASLQLRFGRRPDGAVQAGMLEAARAVFRRAYLHRYRRLRPESDSETARWELPAAAALTARRAGRMQRQLLRRIDVLLERSGRA